MKLIGDWLRLLSFILIHCSNKWHVCFGDDTIMADIFEYFTLSDETLPVANGKQLGGYDKDSGLIWILGGHICDTCVYSYNITSDTVSTETSLSSGIENNNPDNSVLINSIIYYIDEDGTIGKYDTTTSTQTHAWFDDTDSLVYGCMVANIENTLLFVLDNADEFYIIDIENETIVQGPVANFDRVSPSCAVSDQNDMYVMFGDVARIEKISLDGDILSQKWQVLSLDLDVEPFWDYLDCTSFDSLRHTRSILINEMIYILGLSCYNQDISGSNSDGVILKFDPNLLTMEFVGRLYDENYIGLFTYVYDYKGGIDFNRVYFIGGYPEYTFSSLIYYSNDFSFAFSTSMPTSLPTALPSSKPTQQPSEIATNEPTLLPSNNPTIEPSNAPTQSPTAFATEIPSNIPSEMPSLHPTVDINVNIDSADELSSSNGTNTTSENMWIIVIVIIGVILIILFCCLMLFVFRGFKQLVWQINDLNANSKSLRAMNGSKSETQVLKKASRHDDVKIAMVSNLKCSVAQPEMNQNGFKSTNNNNDLESDESEQRIQKDEIFYRNENNTTKSTKVGIEFEKEGEKN